MYLLYINLILKVSTFPTFLVLVAFLSECLSRVIIRDVVYGHFRCHLLDFVVSMESCMLAWETITIFQAHGIESFGITLYITLLTKSYRYQYGAGISCPYTLIQSYMARFQHKVYCRNIFHMRV